MGLSFLVVIYDMNLETTTLSNGIRLIHIRQRGEVAYCGAIINTGTRDELDNENGFAHLNEHLLFKGTSKRNYIQIINRMEDVGGDMNAFTTKEDTTIYSVFLRRHLERAFELTADMIFNSTYEENVMRKEIEVVLDEIDSYIDNPSELIMDDFEDELFNGYSIGRNILGTRKRLERTHSADIIRFNKRCYTTDQIVFFVMGDYKMERVTAIAEKHLGHIAASTRSFNRTTPKAYEPHTITKHRKTSQVHCVIGNRAYCADDNKRYTFSLLNYILGGNCMSNRLNMALREKHALVYEVESQYVPYCDTGAWSIYLGTDNKDIDKALELIKTELARLKDTALSDMELALQKRKIMSQMTIASENRENWLLGTAKQFMNKGRIEKREETEQFIAQIKAQDIQDCANEIFDTDKFTYIFYR